MHFLLSHQEYERLLAERAERIAASRDELQDFCTKAAIYIPVPRDWAEDKTPAPWGCILDKDTNPGYCDDCPVSKICPYTRKIWSK